MFGLLEFQAFRRCAPEPPYAGPNVFFAASHLAVYFSTVTQKTWVGGRPLAKKVRGARRKRSGPCVEPRKKRRRERRGEKALDTLETAVDRVLSGDHSAFQQIVDATSQRLVRLGARIVGNQADAEDVVQEAYVKAYKALTSGDFERRSSTNTWLYRIVVNGAIDARRSRTRRAEASDEQFDPGWDGAALAEARVALSELDEWLESLPTDQRAALVLQSMEGLNNTEIAQVMGVSEGAVEQRLVRARATLRHRREQS